MGHFSTRKLFFWLALVGIALVPSVASAQDEAEPSARQPDSVEQNRTVAPAQGESELRARQPDSVGQDRAVAPAQSAIELRAREPDYAELVDCIGNPTTGGLSPEVDFTCTCSGVQHCQWLSDKCEAGDTAGQWTCDKDYSTHDP